MFKNYKEDLVKLGENHLKLIREFNVLKESYDILNAKYQDELLVNSSLTKKIEETADDFEEFLKRYEAVISSPEYYNKEREEYISDLKREINRSYATGRLNAYSELGVKVYEATKRGNTMAVEVTDNAEIVNMIEEIDEKQLEEIMDEIEIDDLIELGA